MLSGASGMSGPAVPLSVPVRGIKYSGTLNFFGLLDEEDAGSMPDKGSVSVACSLPGGDSDASGSGGKISLSGSSSVC